MEPEIAPAPTVTQNGTLADGQPVPMAPESVFESTTLWVAVAFVLLFAFIIYKKLYVGILTGLDERAVRIKREIEEARRLRDEAEALLAKYQKKAREAAREAESIIERAREEATLASEQARADMIALIARREQVAHDRIAQAEANAVAEVRKAAVAVATEAARTVIADHLAGDAGRTLIDRQIATLGSRFAA